jgi:23S rRNA (adenine-N6)-dimethyltransferase
VPAGGNVRWGWHRLGDRWAERLVADANIVPGELVLDIGAGDGAITAPLVAAGARVVAVEMHPQRLAVLRRRFADAPVTVVRADAADLRLPRRPFRVVACPPYAITSAVLRRLLAAGSNMVAADLILQHAAARRWADGAAPGAGRWRHEFTATLGPRVPRVAFTPRPAIDTTTLVLRRVPSGGVRGRRGRGRGGRATEVR